MKSVRTALRVFEEVAARQPVGLSELSRALDVPKASVQRALTTLEGAGWLRHDVSRPGLWVVTARFSVVADTSPVLIGAREAARPHLDALRESTAGYAGLFVLDGDRMVLVAGPEERTLRTLDAEAGPLPVHLSAGGRAILSRLPDDTVEELLARVLPTADPGAGPRLRRALDQARGDGYAVVAGEYHDDLGVVGAAVVDADGAPVAALAVMVPVERLDGAGTATLGRAVADAAAAVSATVGGPALVP